MFHQCVGIARNTALATPVAVNCVGGTATEFHGCTLNDAMFSGDSTLAAHGTVFGDLTLADTVAAVLHDCSHGAFNTNATAVLDERQRTGTAVFGAVTDVTVTFDLPFSDGSYQVSLEVDSRPVSDETPWVTGKAGVGFTINFQTAQTLTVTWLAVRLDM